MSGERLQLPESRALLGPVLARAFPRIAAVGTEISPIVGGRVAAEKLVARVEPADYARTRNFLGGAVTGLSPHLRHGVVGLTEVFAVALQKVRQPRQAEKLISELAWRDYYQRVYGLIGARVWDDLEPYKTGFTARDYADELPADISLGQTGLACMDGFALELKQTGYLHNHARMWMAAYVVHHRRVKWQAGARWFLHHLLDGDVASNNLSWQWVASPFSHKPYFFNRENLERYTEGKYCADCPARKKCPFQADYDTLAGRLFPRLDDPVGAANVREPLMLRTLADDVLVEDLKPEGVMGDAVAWVHEDALRPGNAAAMVVGSGRAISVLDEDYFAGQRYSLKRVGFIAESVAGLAGLEGEVQIGPTAETVVAFARRHGAARILTTESLNPAIRQIMADLAQVMPLVVMSEPPFVSLRSKTDLTRFSRYWRKAEGQLLK